MYVKIYKLGEEQEVATFLIGIHVLGRGPSLQCDDKRVSRNHATLEISEQNVKLTSTHVNPCFLKAANSKTITILKKDSASQLNDGDSFALLPDDFWFKVKLTIKDEPQNGSVKKQETECQGTNKRFSCNDLKDLPPGKKPKIELNENIDMSEVASSSAEENRLNTSATDQNNFLTSGSTVEVTEEHEHLTTDLPEESNTSPVESISKDLDLTDINDFEVTKPPIKESDENPPESTSKDSKSVNIINHENIDEAQNQEEAKETRDVLQDDVPNEETKKQEQDTPSNDITGAAPGPAQPKPHREKCWYGAECYRKNPAHRQGYTHPGDSDFESDPDDNRPSCSYGASCYRKNKNHRQQYKHPPRERPGKKKRSRKKVDRLNAADSQEVRDFYDEFADSEDPFIADDDSDEYTEESDVDSDWEESQETDEEGENVKRLLKEANRFVKK